MLSRKLKNVSQIFNNNPLSLCPTQRHLGLILDSNLIFNENIKNILSKANKSIGLLRKFQPVLLRSSLLTVYKKFTRNYRFGLCCLRQNLQIVVSRKILVDINTMLHC